MPPYAEPVPPGPGQESVWRFPRPARVEPTTAHLVVRMGDRIIAETRRGFRAIETSHPPSYYFPPADVDMARLEPARRRSQCEWKGGARYFDVVGEGRRAAEAAWSYPDPTPDFAAITDFLAFYPQRVGACFFDGERVTPQEGDFYGGWITSGVVGPFKGGPGTMGW